MGVEIAELSIAAFLVTVGIGFALGRRGWNWLATAAAILAVGPPAALFWLNLSYCMNLRRGCTDADFGFGVGVVLLYPATIAAVMPGLLLGKLVRKRITT